MRWFQSTASFLLPMLVITARVAGVAAAAEQPDIRPNIVVFLCDDLGEGDIAALGSRDIKTPSIDRLFADGTRLARHWAGNAVCAPSRCVLMTGRHPGHAVVRSNREVKPEGQHPMPEGTVTLASLLGEAGYATGGFGKWGLGAPGSVSDPLASGFDHFFGYNCQRHAHTFYPDYLWDDDRRVPLDNPPVPRGGKLPPDAGPADFATFIGTTYSADVIADASLAFLEQAAGDAKNGKPFFLYVPTTVPHLALQVPPDEPSLPGYIEHFSDDKPYRGGGGYVPCEHPLATYAAMITRMDRHLGRIMQLLEKQNLADNTIVLFTSDNGATFPGCGGIDTGRLKSNGSLRGWKGSPYEGGLRVPTVIRFPGRIAAGRVIEAPNGFEDWLPTLLSLVGLADRVPKGLDGVDLSSVLLGEDEPDADRSLYRELTEGRWQAAVAGRFKAIRRGKNRGREAGPLVVYDLLADPAEQVDIAAEKPEVAARLAAFIDTEHEPNEAFALPFADTAASAK